jgi:membrane-associated protease RseP (regulator of RpoE activity)
VPTFVIQKDKNLKANFGKLKSQLDAYSLAPMLREGEEEAQCTLRVFSIRKELESGTAKKRKIPLQIILLAATIITVSISGYFISQSFFSELKQSASLSLMLLTAAEYAASLMAILVVHELGHVIATKLHLIKSTFPYFVPAPPLLGPNLPTPGTFGAVILQTTSAVNRDQLFDLGIAGPLSGFIVALLVTFMGVSLSKSVVATGVGGTFPPPLFYIIIGLFPAGMFPASTAIALHPVALAGYIGLIITCLNLFPVSQLDGGHVSRAAFGASGYAKASLLSIVVLLILGFISPTIFLPFALLIIFFSFLGAAHPGPLDDVSKITKGRKMLMVLGFVVLILSLPMDYLRLLQYLP